MRHDGGLGQAGRPGGEDEESALARGDLGAHLRVVRLRFVRGLCQVLGGDHDGRQCAELVDRRTTLRTHHKDPALQQADAVGKRVVSLVVVEHPGGGAELHRCQHEQQRLGTVGQHDADHIAALYPVSDQHRGIAIDDRVGLAVAVVAALEPQEGAVRVTVRRLLEDRTDRPRRVGRVAQRPRIADDAGQIPQQTGQSSADVQQPDG